MKSNHKSTLIFVLIVVVIDTAGFGLIFPVLPQLLTNLLQSDISTAAKYGGWLSFAYAIMQFVFAPVLGNLSDQYGRRPVLLSSLFGFSIDCIFLAFAPSILWLFVGRTIAGITGASYSVASACVADFSTDDNRTKNFGLINAGFGLGFIIGPIIGGTLGQFGTHTPFIVAAILSFINFIFGYYFFPESLKANNRRKFDWKRANPFGSLRHLKKYPIVSGLVVSYFLINIGSHAVQSNWTYYTMLKFNWDEKMVGISLGVAGVLVSLVQGGLIRWTSPKLGNEKSIYIGLALYTIGMFLFSIASEGWMMFVILIPYCIAGIAGPALRAIISNHFSPSEQGEVQGTIASLMSAATIIGPPMMSTVFYFFTHSEAPFIFPGAPFVLGGVLMFVSTIIAYLSFKKRD